MSRTHPTPSEFLTSRYDPQLEREFFSRIILPNGSVKSTSEHRLDDLNLLSLPYVKQMQSPVRLLDVAASSGVSTAEWYEQLMSEGIQFSLTATDLTVNAYHLKLGLAEAILDKEMNFIHLAFGGRGMPPRAPWPIGFIPTLLKRYLAFRMALGAKYNVPIKLLTKRLRDGNFAIIEDDLLNGDGLKQDFDVIRAANILNISYFSKGLLRRMISNLKRRLSNHGLLIICRTKADRSNHGTVFQVHGESFTALDRIGDGSEVEHLVNTVSST
jgi:hypothetical protein